MEDEKGNMTDAEMQIERLKKMKMEKELRDKEAGKTHFSPQGSTVLRNIAQTAKPSAIKAKVKHSNTAKLTKENYEKLTRISKQLRKNIADAKFSRDKLTNMLLNKVLDNTIYIEICRTQAELEEALKKIRIDSV